MALQRNGVAVGTAQRNGVTLDKVTVNGTTVWENWKEFSQSLTALSNITNSDYVTTRSVTFEVTENHKITNVKCTAYVYNHTGDQSANVSAVIEVSNNKSSWNKVADSGSSAYSGQGKTFSKTTSYSWTDGCPYKYIRCSSTGGQWKRNVTGVFSGYQKGA